MEQRPRQRQPLALPPRQVGRPLQKGRVQPLLAAEKVRQFDPLQDGPHLCLIGCGASHAQVFPDGPLEQIALMAHIGHVFQQTILPDVGEFLVAHRYGTMVSPVPPHQD